MPIIDKEKDYCTYTLNEEGGVWRESQVMITASEMDRFFSGELKPIYHAYKFASGRIWDTENGWRNTETNAIVAQAVKARTFSTGATRDTDTDKLDYEAFLSSAVLECYAQYMHKNRVQSDGRLRDGDNWQKGIPFDVYIKSAFRHFMDWWRIHRDETRTSCNDAELEEALCALLFNAQGYLFEILKHKGRTDESRSVKNTLSHGIDDKHSGGFRDSLDDTGVSIPSLRDTD